MHRPAAEPLRIVAPRSQMRSTGSDRRGFVPHLAKSVTLAGGGRPSAAAEAGSTDHHRKRIPQFSSPISGAFCAHSISALRAAAATRARRQSRGAEVASAFHSARRLGPSRKSRAGESLTDFGDQHPPVWSAIEPCEGSATLTCRPATSSVRHRRWSAAPALDPDSNPLPIRVARGVAVAIRGKVALSISLFATAPFTRGPHLIALGLVGLLSRPRAVMIGSAQTSSEAAVRADPSAIRHAFAGDRPLVVLRHLRDPALASLRDQSFFASGAPENSELRRCASTAVPCLAAT